MLSGIEMMMGQMLKGLGVDPEQIGGLATALSEGIQELLKSAQRQEGQNKRILAALESMGATIPPEIAPAASVGALIEGTVINGLGSNGSGGDGDATGERGNDG